MIVNGHTYPDIEPKPCRKCGMSGWGRDRLILDYDCGYFWVRCSRCGDRGPDSFEDSVRAVELWNDPSNHVNLSDKTILSILLKIYKDGPIDYHKLLNDGCRLLNDGCNLTRLEISVGLDRLADLGTYEGKWMKMDGKWVYMLTVTDAGRIILATHTNEKIEL